MLSTIRRYGRAFVLALKFTLRGEKPPLLRVRDQHPQLAAWWQQTIKMVEAVEQAASANNLDAASLKIRVDRREISMATILAAIKYHAEHEYPYLIAHNDSYDQMTLKAINLNDRYLVMRLTDQVDPSLKSVVETLGKQLENLPADHENES